MIELATTSAFPDSAWPTVKDSLTVPRCREAKRLAADAEDVKALESLAKEIEAVKPTGGIKPSANPAGEEVEG